MGLIQETPPALIAPSEFHKPLAHGDDRKVYAFCRLVGTITSTVEMIPTHDTIPLLGKASHVKAKSLTASRRVMMAAMPAELLENPDHSARLNSRKARARARVHDLRGVQLQHHVCVCQDDLRCMVADVGDGTRHEGGPARRAGAAQAAAFPLLHRHVLHLAHLLHRLADDAHGRRGDHLHEPRHHVPPGLVLLGEPTDRIDFACALLSYVGVFFVARPAFLFGHNTVADSGPPEASTFAIACAFGAAFMQACAYIATHKLHALPNMTILHYFSLFGTPFSVAMVLAFDIALEYPTQPDVLLAVVASAAVSCVGSIFLTLGFQQENAGIASVMRYFDVLFVFIWDTTLMGERVNAYSVFTFGGLVIIAGAKK